MIHRYQETNQNPKLRVNKKTTNIDRMINRLTFANICFLKPHYVEIDILPARHRSAQTSDRGVETPFVLLQETVPSKRLF